jgi:hypothetical protein
MTEQQNAFWEAIEVFEKEGLLNYVMLIGSWAEYIYQGFLFSEFIPNLKTRDIDFFYVNLRKPKERSIHIANSLLEKGFVYSENSLTGVGKFLKDGLIELEFLTLALGKGNPVNEIPSLKIKAEALRELALLNKYPLQLNCRGYIITVPEPEAYVMQKILVNPMRSEGKKAKDIQAVANLTKYIDKSRLSHVFECLSTKEQHIVNAVRKQHFLGFRNLAKICG